MNLMRMKALRNVAQAVLDRRSGDLNFNSWDCGTHACLLGHYERVHAVGIIQQGRVRDVANINIHFGFDEDYPDLFMNLFSQCFSRHPYDELERRIGIIDKMIAAEEAKLQPEPQKLLPLLQAA